jgi:hypothetical protein
VSKPIPEEHYYDELEAATTFIDFVRLCRAVLFDYEASPENDRRQDQLVFRVQRVGMSMDRVMREARKQTTGSQGAIEYKLEDVQEMEVLIDALDDPRTRWVVAAILIERWYHSPRKVPRFIHERVLATLDATVEVGVSAASQALDALNQASFYPREVIPCNELPVGAPRQLWACRDFLFTEQAWAQAYSDFMAAMDAAEEEEA